MSDEPTVRGLIPRVTAAVNATLGPPALTDQQVKYALHFFFEGLAEMGNDKPSDWLRLMSQEVLK